jgi:FkbM family methyltransferase
VSRLTVNETEVRRASWLGLKPALARLLATPFINSPMRSAARFVPKSIGHRLPINTRSVEYCLDNGESFRLLDPLHDIVARDVYWGKGKASEAAERHKLATLERLSRAADLFIDVGAYAGICSLIAAKANPALRVVAYELVPENYLLLVKNIIENDLVGRIDARLRGLGAQCSSVQLPPWFGAASFLTSISLGSRFDDGISIPVVRLDDELGGAPNRVVMKLDVEGFEGEVMAGAMQLIRKNRPDIVCEVLPENNELPGVVNSLLSPLGYQFFCFDDQGLRPRTKIELGLVMRDWLLTCRPELVA